MAQMLKGCIADLHAGVVLKKLTYFISMLPLLRSIDCIVNSPQSSYLRFNKLFLKKVYPPPIKSSVSNGVSCYFDQHCNIGLESSLHMYLVWICCLVGLEPSMIPR